MHRRLRATTIAALFIIGACGGDDDDAEDGGDERLSKAELIAQGDALCQKAVDDTTPLFAALFPTGTETPPAEDAAGPMGEAAEILRAEYEDFSALRPPAEDQEEFDEILVGFEDAIVGIEDAAELAAAGDTEGYLEALAAANEADALSRELMAAYGFEVCAGEA